jgi:putative ABC transport system permease protein
VVARGEDSKTGMLEPPTNGEVADRVAAMTAFDLVARISVGAGLMVGGSEPVVVLGSAVDAPFYRIFGMPIARGRMPEGAGEAAISTRLWEQRFGRREDVLGRVIRFRDHQITVVGITGARYDFPYRNEIWFVMPEWPGAADEPYVDLALRMAPGVTLEAARTELAVVQQSLERDRPDVMSGRRLMLQSSHDAETGHLRQPLVTLLTAAALVVLIACANVANLLLAAATGREREMALRRAIGAPPWRLARTVLVESSVLAALGVGGGVLLAVWTVPLILANAPDVITRQTEFTLSWPVLVFAGLLAALVTAGFGLAPAVRLARVPALGALNQVSSTMSGRQSRLMAGFVGVQAAVGVVLVVGTALMASSFARMMDAVTAMPVDRLSAVRVDVAQAMVSAPRVAQGVVIATFVYGLPSSVASHASRHRRIHHNPNTRLRFFGGGSENGPHVDPTGRKVSNTAHRLTLPGFWMSSPSQHHTFP